jgi:hypothetical protein
MSVELRLNASWVPEEPRHHRDVVVRRDSVSSVTFGGTVTLPVRVLDPASFVTLSSLVHAAREADDPGELVLVAGHVPSGWRTTLRSAGVSFASDDGTIEIAVTEIRWADAPGQPGYQASGPGEAAGPDVGRGTLTGVITGEYAALTPGADVQAFVPLEQRAQLAQELLIGVTRGQRLSFADLAERTGTDTDFVAQVVRELAVRRFAQEDQPGGAPAGTAADERSVRVTDPAGLARLLAVWTAWPAGGKPALGYVFGRNIWDVAALVSQAAAEAGVGLAVTGRAGAAYYGVSGPAGRSEVHCWVAPGDVSFLEAVERLGLEPAGRDTANVLLVHDGLGLGTSASATIRSGRHEAVVASPVRVWCDLHGEAGIGTIGTELWKRVVPS